MNKGTSTLIRVSNRQLRRSVRRRRGSRALSNFLSVLPFVIVFPFFLFQQGEKHHFESPIPYSDIIVASEVITLTPEPTKIITPTPTPIIIRVKEHIVKPNYSQKEIEDYIRVIFGRDAEIAIAISKGECNPGNKKYPACQLVSDVENSIGLFQINLKSKTQKIHYDRIPGNTLDEKITWLEDPLNNTLYAYWLYTRSGNFNAWTAYTSGSYERYL